MNHKSITIPKFAARHITEMATCRHCHRPLSPGNVIAAGICHGPRQILNFTATIICGQCKKKTPVFFPWKPLDANNWAGQLAAAMPSTPVLRQPKPQAAASSTLDGESDECEQERPEFAAFSVMVLDYIPGNYDHADGEPVSLLTLARSNFMVETLAFSMADTRRLVTRALLALATEGDAVAERILDKCFEADEKGNFRWPTEPPPDWC